MLKQIFYLYNKIIFKVIGQDYLLLDMIFILDQYYYRINYLKDDITAQFVFIIKDSNELKEDSFKIQEYKNLPFICKETVKIGYGDGFIIFIPSTNSPYPIIINKKDKIFYIFVKTNIEKWKYYLLRFLQELLMTILEQKGWVNYHASSVSFKNQGILFLGPSGAGKTTLMSYFCFIGKASFICNDMCSILKYTMYYDSGPIAIRNYTLQNLRLNYDNPNPLVLSISKFIELAEVQHVSLCNINVIILVRFNDNLQNGLQISQVNDKILKKELHKNNITLNKLWNHKNFLDSQISEEQLRINCELQEKFISATMPCFLVEFGLNIAPIALINQVSNLIKVL